LRVFCHEPDTEKDEERIETRRYEAARIDAETWTGAKRGNASP